MGKLITIAFWKLSYLITWINRIEQLLLTQVRKFDCFYPGPHILSMRDIIIYIAWCCGSISWNVASLNILNHDVINLYYEHWTDKRKYFTYLVCDPQNRPSKPGSTDLKAYFKSCFNWSKALYVRNILVGTL